MDVEHGGFVVMETPNTGLYNATEQWIQGQNQLAISNEPAEYFWNQQQNIATDTSLNKYIGIALIGVAVLFLVRS